MADEPLDIRKVVSVSASDAKAIEDFRFANRIKSEAEAIRHLLRVGLHFADVAARQDAEDAARKRKSRKD